MGQSGRYDMTKRLNGWGLDSKGGKIHTMGTGKLRNLFVQIIPAFLTIEVD